MTKEQIISQIEQIYFTGSFSESTIRNDLQLRKSMDIRSGGQTNNLGEKRSFYIQEIDIVLNLLKKMQTACSDDSAFVSRCKRCEDQVNKLLAIVRSF